MTLALLASGPGIAGIDTAWEKVVQWGRRGRGRLFDGDETHQGRHVPPAAFSIQHARLYRHRSMDFTGGNA